MTSAKWWFLTLTNENEDEDRFIEGKGINVNTTDDWDNTPLQVLKQYECSLIVESTDLKYVEYLQQLYERQPGYDIELEIQGQLYLAHRCILSICADVFGPILHFIYTGRLDIEKRQRNKTIALAKFLQFNNLAEILERVIAKCGNEIKNLCKNHLYEYEDQETWNDVLHDVLEGENFPFHKTDTITTCVSDKLTGTATFKPDMEEPIRIVKEFDRTLKYVTFTINRDKDVGLTNPDSRKTTSTTQSAFTVMMNSCNSKKDPKHKDIKAANFTADRVIMPIAIVPMADEYNWDLHGQGWVLSSFAVGYMSSQVFEEVDQRSLPTIFHIFAHTIPGEERSRAFGYLVACGSIGQTVASVVIINITTYVLALMFYLFGFMGIFWVLAWAVLYQEARTSTEEEFIEPPKHGLIDIDRQQYLIPNDSRTRGIGRFYQERTKTETYGQSFFPKTIRDWNQLPAKTTSADSIEVSELL
ncbi:unnamed protein product [Mytilus edulis]|uniref:BTB domain-containing protein n=1 Tax=Mytilus edulis TaxID=6550 RepID=A0A8S3R683_MYTED|nr:unnamed protein product [Mytilus edulis]